jgi:hypothetical protein
LQAWVQLLKASALAIEKSIEVDAFSRKMRFNFHLHRVRIRAGQHGLIGKTEGVHRIELPELHVIARAAASLGKEFVEEEFHHQKGGTQIEAVLAEAEFCVTPSDNILLFENLNTEASLCEEHRGCKSARPCPHDYDVPFLLTVVNAHVLARWRSVRNRLAG